MCAPLDARPKFRLLMTLSAFAFALLLVPQSITAEILPKSGTFDGVYHCDRWGVGHFAFYLVAPRLHAELKRVEGKRVRLVVRRAVQPMNPGRAMIYEIGEVTVLPDLPLEIEISLASPSVPSERRALCIYLANRGNVTIDTSTQNLAVWIRKAEDVANREQPDLWFPEYSRGQMGVRTVESVQWLGNHLVVARGAVESGHHLRIEPGQRFPLVARIQLPSGEYEAHARARARLGEKWLEPTEAWFPLGWPSTPPDASDVKERLDADAAIQLKEYELSPAKDGWHRLAFRVMAPAHATRSIPLCTRGKIPVVAGILSAVDREGCESIVSVRPCYNCSNMGEPWQLVPIPDGGITTEMQLPRINATRLKLDLLTDRGLETLWMDKLDFERGWKASGPQ